MYSPNPGIRYGLALRGIGRNLAYHKQQNQQTQVSTVESHQELELGIAMRYPYTPINDRPYLTLSVSNEKIFGLPGLWYKAGAEWLIIHQLGLRAGYANSPNFKGITVGFGVNLPAVTIDYALSPTTHSIRQFQQISISVDLSVL